MSSILNRLNLKILNILKYQIKSDISKIKTKKFTFNSKILGIPISLFTMFYLKEKTNFDNNLMCKNFKKIKLTDIESLQENEIREVKYGSNPGESILLMKYQSNYIALSSRCPHYGAPMKDGFLYDNLIKCPWHGASFEITTGLCESGPALDGLKKYEILQEAENYYALVDDSLLDPKVYKRDPLNSSRYVIVGGGPAGLACAETLRHAGYTGHIEIFSADSLLPYDRPILSKSTPSDPSKITLRDAKFFSNYDIEIYKNAKVSGINSSEKLIKLSNGETKKYDKLLVATGSSPKIPRIEGSNLKGVYTLRDFNDNQKIKSAAQKAKKIVIVGAGFIGIEMANTLRSINQLAEITIIDSNTTPFQKVLGKEVGSIIQSIHEANGIQFKMNSQLVKIVDENKDSFLDAIIYETKKENENKNIPSFKTDLTNSKISESKEIKADMVLLALGVNPNTEILQSTVTLEKELAICDSYLSTSDPDIWAAGDILSYPSLQTGERIYSPHWVNAQQQGAIAALNMLGKKIPYDYVPFFWTRFFEKTLQYVGVTDKFDEVIIEGNFEVNNTDRPSFKAFYIKNKKVCGFACMNSPNSANIMYEVFKNNYVVTVGALKSRELTIEKLKDLLKKMNSRCSKVNCLCANSANSANSANRDDSSNIKSNLI